jgi:sterol desaturase/sphingolipid hydroxylase (fatty acid hydroxylase superfamily)
MNAASVAIVLIFVNLVVPILFAAVYRVTVEKRWPMEAPRPAGDRTNLTTYLSGALTMIALSPAVSVFATFLANRAGSGFIVLPATGWSAVGGFLFYFLVIDFCEFVIHRVQHAWPWLWAMHSLHHSDPQFDASTSVRHHWGIAVIRGFAVAAPMSLLFKAPPLYLVATSVLSYHVYLMHANVRLTFGRFEWLLSSPGYHRLHHSSDPQYYNQNFASILPIWDVMFGSRQGRRNPAGGAGYRRPRPIPARRAVLADARSGSRLVAAGPGGPDG